MDRAPLPDGWAKPIRRSSVRGQTVLGVPVILLAVLLYAVANLALVLAAWAQAAALLAGGVWLARALTRRDPFWLEILRQKAAAGLARAAATRGRSLRLSGYRAPR